MQLPMFPAGLTASTKEISFQCESAKVVYFYGHLPVFQHDADDAQSFRLFTSQLIEQTTWKPNGSPNPAPSNSTSSRWPSRSES
jgi:hypothetical protein